MKNPSDSHFSALFTFAKTLLGQKHPNNEATVYAAIDRMVGDIYKQWCGGDSGTGPESFKISDLPGYQDFRNFPESGRDALAIYLAETSTNIETGPRAWNAFPPESHIRQVLLQSLLKSKHPFSGETLARLGTIFLSVPPEKEPYFFGQPLSYFFRQVSTYANNAGAIRPDLAGVLHSMLQRLEMVDSNSYFNPNKNKLLPMLEELLFNHQPQKSVRPFLWQQGDVLADFADHLSGNMTPAEQNAWYNLLHYTQKVTGSKPVKTFRKDVEILLKAAPDTFFREKIGAIFRHATGQKDITTEHIYREGTSSEYRHVYLTFLNEFNANTVKGLVWAVSGLLDPALLQALAGLADRCFKKMPGKGYASGAVGNAVLWVLAESGRPEAIGHLSKLKLKNIQANTKVLIDHYLVDIARKSGLTVADLEDMSVSDFGLDAAGQTEQYFDGYRALVRLESVGKTSVQWFKPDGTPQKSVPGAVKEKFPEAVKQLSAMAKDLASSSTAQRDRLDRMLRIERSLPFDKFEKTILQHGLLGWLAKRLIWKISHNKQDTNAFYTGENWRDSSGHIVDWVGSDCTIQLWHPAGSPMDETMRWRAYLEEIRLVQPMKQAFREIYLLTDAELRTRTYSNRFAAHLLKQHQFAALARLRGWQYTLLGAYDDGRDMSIAQLNLQEKSLRAEYWISEVNANDAWNDTGIWLYVATDQVRFYQNNSPEPMNLVDVPPVVLSEVLRDADLFVGVASVGNDPAWQDTGGLPAHRDYWQTYSFGELSEMAKSRRDILIRLVPRLKIASVAEVRDRFLIVRGKLRTYKIHLGSGNILMEPNDQYLCIVPDRRAADTATKGNLFLPFEGDTGLSVIISKALMLASDDQITDTTITRQIRM